MSTQDADFDIVGGRVLDPGQGLDAMTMVSIRGGRIAEIGAPPTVDVKQVEAAGLLVTPGLVDLHTHLYPGVPHYGIEPDQHCLSRGVTTAIDAGSAGAQTFPGLRRYVIDRSRTGILAFLNIAVQGMISSLVGELDYAGMTVRGKIRDVLLRGQAVVSNGALVDRAADGRYLRSDGASSPRSVPLEERSNAR